MTDSTISSTALTSLPFDVQSGPAPSDPSANPFRLVVDPEMRQQLRRALFDLIENHDRELARYVAAGDLALDSYKEYVEIFARSLRDTMQSTEGISFLLRSCGFEVDPQEINLQPDIRWKTSARPAS